MESGPRGVGLPASGALVREGRGEEKEGRRERERIKKKRQC